MERKNRPYKTLVIPDGSLNPEVTNIILLPKNLQKERIVYAQPKTPYAASQYHVDPVHSSSSLVSLHRSNSSSFDPPHAGSRRDPPTEPRQEDRRVDVTKPGGNRDGDDDDDDPLTITIKLEGRKLKLKKLKKNKKKKGKKCKKKRHRRCCHVVDEERAMSHRSDSDDSEEASSSSSSDESDLNEYTIITPRSRSDRKELEQQQQAPLQAFSASCQTSMCSSGPPGFPPAPLQPPYGAPQPYHRGPPPPWIPNQYPSLAASEPPQWPPQQHPPIAGPSPPWAPRQYLPVGVPLPAWAAHVQPPTVSSQLPHDHRATVMSSLKKPSLKPRRQVVIDPALSPQPGARYEGLEEEMQRFTAPGVQSRMVPVGPNRYLLARDLPDGSVLYQGVFKTKKGFS